MCDADAEAPLHESQVKAIMMSQNPYGTTGSTAESSNPDYTATDTTIGAEPSRSWTNVEDTPTAYSSSFPSSTSEDTKDHVTEDAKEHAKQVGTEAVQGGQHVASTAAEQARSVASEAGDQAKNLLSEARSQFADQASTQQSNLANWLRSMADELHTMAHAGAQQSSKPSSTGTDAGSGVATKFASQASGHVDGAADWLEKHDPSDLIDQATRFARQRPGTFLAIAALGGLVAGRLTRGLTADSSPRTGTDATPVAETDLHGGSGVTPTTDAFSFGMPERHTDPYASPVTDADSMPARDGVAEAGGMSSEPHEADRR